MCEMWEKKVRRNMTYKAKTPADTPKTKLGIDERALIHYIHHMRYTGKRSRFRTSDADAYIEKYGERHGNSKLHRKKA